MTPITSKKTIFTGRETRERNNGKRVLVGGKGREGEDFKVLKVQSFLLRLCVFGEWVIRERMQMLVCLCVFVCLCGCFVTAAQPPSCQALGDLEKIPRKTEEDNKAPRILAKASKKKPTGTRQENKLELFVFGISFFFKKEKTKWCVS